MSESNSLSSTSNDAVSGERVVARYPVYMGASNQSLMLFQYPMRSKTKDYDSVKHVSTRIRPGLQVEMELALNTTTEHYDKLKGDNLGPDERRRLETHSLQGVVAGAENNLTVAVFREGKLILTPLKQFVQLKPTFKQLDNIDSRNASATKERDAAANADSGGDTSQDEEKDKMEVVKVKVLRAESDEQKKRRLASFKYMETRRGEVRWLDCNYHPADDSLSKNERKRLWEDSVFSAPPVQPLAAGSEYAKVILPGTDEQRSTINGGIPLADLKELSVEEQVKRLLKQAKVLKFAQLVALMPRNTSQQAVLKALVECAVLVQGNWVIQSSLLWPEGGQSAHSAAPAEALVEGRDFLLWRFNTARYIVRKDVVPIIKLPAEDIKDILEQVSRPRANKGWEFLLQYDTDFVSRFHSIAEQQQRQWEARFAQLQLRFKIPKDMEKKVKLEPGIPSPARRRHRSRSGPRSGDELI